MLDVRKLAISSGRISNAIFCPYVRMW